MLLIKWYLIWTAYNLNTCILYKKYNTIMIIGSELQLEQFFLLNYLDDLTL